MALRLPVQAEVLFPLLACGAMGPTEPSVPDPGPGDLKVLFIGASYLEVNDLPGIFAGLSEAAGKELYVGSRVRSGYYLDFFAGEDPGQRLGLGRLPGSLEYSIGRAAPGRSTPGRLLIQAHGGP